MIQKQKTILLPIYNGIRAKNFFYTDIYEELVGRVKMVIVIPPSKLAYYQKEFSRPNVIFEPLEVLSEPSFGRFLSLVAFNLLDTDSVRLKQWWTYLKYGRFDKFLLKRVANICFSKLKFTSSFIRFLDKFVEIDAEVAKLLNKYKPDMVIIPDIVYPPDRLFLRTTKRMNFFVLGMVRAWDNLTSKGVIQILPDKLIVHTNEMKGLAIRLAGMPEKDIYVTGIPHYDIFFKPRNITRQQFLKSMGIPADRKILLCAPFLNSNTDTALEIIHSLVGAIHSGRLPRDTHILVRYRPGTPPIKEHLLPKSDYLTVTQPCSRHFSVKNTQISEKDWEFTPEDLEFLMNSLYYSDVTLNTISTLTIDAAIFDKPVINHRFDADTTPPKHRVSVLLKYDHYKSIEASSGVKKVWNMEELIDSVDAYLKNPSLDKESRKSIVKEQVEFTDGKSGKRTADVIRGLLFDTLPKP